MAFQNLSGVDARGAIFSEVHEVQNLQITHRALGDKPGTKHFLHVYNSHHLKLIACHRPDLHSLLSPVANAAYNRSGRVARCQDGTREELIATIKTWVDKGSDQPICWLNGPAGAGKSAVSQTFAEWCDAKDILVASFFFLRGSGNRSKITNFIPSLVYQLSISLPATKPLIEHVLQSESSIFQSSFKHQFMKMVIEPILAVRPQHRTMATAMRRKPMVVVIDALDECDDKDLMSVFIESIIQLFQEKRHPIRVFVASRVDEHLRRILEIPIIYALSLQDFDARDDIRKFFQLRLSTIHRESRIMGSVPWPWPSDADLETLVRKSDGSFIFAHTLVNFIDDGTDLPHRKLQKALMAHVGLDALYTEILSAVPRGHNFQRVMGTIMLLVKPLSITSLGHLLQLETIDVLLALWGVQSILLIPDSDDQPVRLFHSSLRDFLTIKQRSGQFFVDPRNHHVLMATDCLKSMTIISEEIIFIDEPQRYASCYWLHHVIQSIELGVDNLQIGVFLMEFMSRGFEKWINSLIFSNQLTNLIEVLSSLISKLKVSSVSCQSNVTII
jgi:hypothetical protein